ncbi:hypothetical protein, partial [Yersinia enterocolitica]
KGFGAGLCVKNRSIVVKVSFVLLNHSDEFHLAGCHLLAIGQKEIHSVRDGRARLGVNNQAVVDFVAFSVRGKTGNKAFFKHYFVSSS